MSQLELNTRWPRLPTLLPTILSALAGGGACHSSDAPLAPSSPVRLPPPPRGPSDRVFASLAATMQRAERSFKQEKKKRAYFLALATSETDQREIAFTLGQVLHQWWKRQQWGHAQVRVGTHRMDGTSDASYPSEAVRMPFPADPLAVGRVLLPALERAHGESLLQFTVTRRYLTKNPIPDRPPDWTVARTVSNIARRPRLRRPRRNLHAALRRASAVFRRHPDVQTSAIYLHAGAWSIHTVTSESTRLYRDGEIVSVAILASTQAPDGEQLDLMWQRKLVDPRMIPSAAELTRSADRLARLLIQLRAAPRERQPYTGPVLIEGQAALATLLHTLGLTFTANRASYFLRFRATADGLVGRRILPLWLSVVDDPTARRHRGLALRGHYRVDDEGIPARRVTLVSRGTLRSLLGSRQPTRALRRSNGHGRYLNRALDVRALPANLLFIPERPLSREALRRRFLALLKRRNLPYGYIVRQVYAATPRPGYRVLSRRWSLPNPALVYRIDTQGRETLVRGVMFVQVERPLEAFGRLVAMGGPPRVAHWFLPSGNWISVTGHSFILDTARLLPAEAPKKEPPLLKNPLSR